MHSQIIPIGGNHFTNDLAVALKIPHNEAERIKINHGSVLAEQLNQSAHITVQGLSGTKPREVQLSVVAEVLGARAEELFDVIRVMVEEKKLHDQVAGGFVLTGGGALIKGMPELGEYILMRACKIGYPIPFGGMTNIMQNPKYSTVLGLLIEASKRKPYTPSANQNANNHRVTFNSKEKDSNHSNTDLIGKLSESLRSVFKEIF